MAHWIDDKWSSRRTTDRGGEPAAGCSTDDDADGGPAGGSAAGDVGRSVFCAGYRGRGVWRDWRVEDRCADAGGYTDVRADADAGDSGEQLCAACFVTSVPGAGGGDCISAGRRPAGTGQALYARGGDCGNRELPSGDRGAGEWTG